MLMLFPASFVFPIHFPILFSKKQQEKHFPSFIIKHELCFPPTYNPLMKYSGYYLGNYCISLYLLSYEYVCANYLMFLCICSVL